MSRRGNKVNVEYSEVSNESVTLSFKIANWSGTTTEDFIEMFFEQMMNAGAVENFSAKISTARVVRMVQES